jgi:hypothetical protein
MTSPREHAVLTVLVRRVDSPTIATCWRRRPMPPTAARWAPGDVFSRDRGLPSLFVLIRKTKAFGPPATVLRIVFPWYIDLALMTLV